MPIFFFHVRDGCGISRDQEGQELPDLAAARREAINTNREMLGERLLHGGPLAHRRIEITDESGHVVALVNASEVLLKDGKPRSYDDDVTKSAPVSKPLQ